MNQRKIKLVYILSQRYSGSTLLSFLLATHPDIATIGERRKFYTHAIQSQNRKIKCSCGEPLTTCPYWTEIKKQLQSELDASYFKRNHTEYRIIEQKHLNALATRVYRKFDQFGLRHLFPLNKRVKKSNDFNLRLIHHVLEKDQANVFLDSSKTARHLLFLSKIDSINLHVLWLTRDPRAQVYSSLKYNPYSIEEAINEWISEMKMNQQLTRQLKLKVHELKYESLCRNPETEMDKVLSFIGLSKNYSTDFREQTQHIMGNAAMRLGNDQKITERTDWVEGLSANQIEKIEHMTRDYQTYYSDTFPPKQ